MVSPVDEVELIGENSTYAHVRYPDGQETTVSTRHLALRGEPMDCLPPSVPMHPGPSLEVELDPQSVSTPDSSQVEEIHAPPTGSGCISAAVRAYPKPGGPACPSFLKKRMNVVIEDCTFLI